MELVGWATLVDTFHGIVSQKYSCGSKLDFAKYDEVDKVADSVATSSKLMPAPPSRGLHKVKDNKKILHIQYQLMTKPVGEGKADTATLETDKVDKLPDKELCDNIRNVLMNKTSMLF